MSELSKASFHVQLNEQERLTFACFEDKDESSKETLIAQLQRKKGEDWETVRSIRLLRQSDGSYTQLPE